MGKVTRSPEDAKFVWKICSNADHGTFVWRELVGSSWEKCCAEAACGVTLLMTMLFAWC